MRTEVYSASQLTMGVPDLLAFDRLFAVFSGWCYC
jgi:hypothetical protein